MNMYENYGDNAVESNGLALSLFLLHLVSLTVWTEVCEVCDLRHLSAKWFVEMAS